jgi:hypothetical protein
MGATQQAFEQFVQSKVLREGTPGMGPKHVDTALASHNLGCCLDALGKVHRAIELVAEAEQVGGEEGKGVYFMHSTCDMTSSL